MLQFEYVAKLAAPIEGNPTRFQKEVLNLFLFVANIVDATCRRVFPAGLLQEISVQSGSVCFFGGSCL